MKNHGSKLIKTQVAANFQCCWENNTCEVCTWKKNDTFLFP